MGPEQPAAGRRLARRAVVAVAAMVFAAVAAVFAGASPALAHNSLTGSDPKDGARLAAAPASVRLSFLSRLDPDTTKVTVTGPDGTTAAAGEPAFAGSGVTVPLRAGPAGRYTVAYEVRSGDGHPIKGTVRFTVTAGVEASPAPSVPPEQPSPTPAPAAPVDPVTASRGTADPVTASRGTAWWPWALGAVVLVVLVGGGAYLLGRRT